MFERRGRGNSLAAFCQTGKTIINDENQLPALGRWIMAVKIDTLETVPPHVFATPKPRKAGRLAATESLDLLGMAWAARQQPLLPRQYSIPATFRACYDV